MEPRRYEQSARAEAVQARRDAIVRAAIERFMTMNYEEITLELIAADAGVSLKTVTRQFGTKEELLLAAAAQRGRDEWDNRVVPPGDIDGVVAALAERYDRLSTANMQLIRLETRIEAVSTIIKKARKDHWNWLAVTFEQWLQRDRQERLAALFGATEIYVWHTLRHHFGMSRRAAENAMRDTLRALVERWEREGS